MEVIIVDNHSTDGSRHYLEPSFPQAKFYWNNENMGFAKACNFGLKQCTGSHILFLNPDTIVGENCFEECISFFKLNQHAGAVGVRMIDESGRFLKESKRAFPSPLPAFFKLSGLAHLFPRSAFFAKYYLGNLSDRQTHEVDVLAGAFMMIKRNVLDITGGFDEAFFMYGEDIDLSYRIQIAGYKNYYYHAVTILHFKGKSTQKSSLHYVRLFYKAMSIFVEKHYDSSKAGVYNFCIHFAIGIKAGLASSSRLIGRVFLPIQNQVNKIKKQNLQEHLQLLVVGDETTYINILKGMNEADKKRAGRIAIFPDEQNALGIVNELNDILKKQHVREIIFCEGQQSFQQIIQQIMRLSNKRIKIKIHAAQSKGLAGG